MRDLVSCFTENSVEISNPSSSCSSYSPNTCISPSLIPSIQNSSTNLYKILLSSSPKQILLKVTWSRSNSGQFLTINFDDNENDNPSSCFKLNTNPRIFRKKKGTKLIEFEHKVEIFWDFSNAKYNSGPEPITGFYVLILIDSEISLILGDFNAEEAEFKKIIKSASPAAKTTLISRKEYCSGSNIYSTKAQFSDTGIPHEILIKCSGENEGFKNPGFSVSIDKKMVIKVKRLQWNFRGNQTIFLDNGLLVDMMWDLHDWLFAAAAGGGQAVFLFRTRSGLDSRLWLEEKCPAEDSGRNEFSLLIYACKNPD